MLNSNITVTGILRLLGGDSFFLKNSHIDLGTTGIISGETNSMRITGLPTGYITRTATLNAPVNADPGNMGILITSSVNLGSTLIKRGQRPQNLPLNSNPVKKYFEITPTNNIALDATIRINYFDWEAEGLQENDLYLYTSPDAGANWIFSSRDSMNSDNNFLIKNNLATLNRFTLSAINMPLPLHFLRINASWQNNNILLSWTTDNEANNDHFDVQRSFSGNEFITIAQVPSEQHQVSEHYYCYSDYQYGIGNNYYRLRQVDKDGRFSYSKILKLYPALIPRNTMIILPNPVKNKPVVAIQLTQQVSGELIISDAAGRIVHKQKAELQKGNNVFEISNFNQPAGIYWISFNAAVFERIGSVFVKQ
jgi:hypothetical protein